MASSSSASSGVPPGFRFHPTDEELLHYYLKKKVAFEKFDLEVIREVDLNKLEPWDLQERCRIGSTPQNEWYFFSHKDKKYPTGSRTNRATNAGFWKATGRDKCIKNSYQKIGMRKTLVFYRGRAPHGQKTDWIMHEYRLEEEADDPQGSGSEDGWVVCRVFKKKTFKIGTEASTSQGVDNPHMSREAATADYSRPLYIHQDHAYSHHQTPNLYKPELSLHYTQMPSHHYSHLQVQNLLPDHRQPPPSYDFLVLPSDSANMVKPYQACEAGFDIGSGSGAVACEPIENMGEGRDQSANDWMMLERMVSSAPVEGRFGSSAAQVNQMNQISHQRGERDSWVYGKQ